MFQRSFILCTALSILLLSTSESEACRRLRCRRRASCQSYAAPAPEGRLTFCRASEVKVCGNDAKCSCIYEFHKCNLGTQIGSHFVYGECQANPMLCTCGGACCGGAPAAGVIHADLPANFRGQLDHNALNGFALPVGIPQISGTIGGFQSMPIQCQINPSNIFHGTLFLWPRPNNETVGFAVPEAPVAGKIYSTATYHAAIMTPAGGATKSHVMKITVSLFGTSTEVKFMAVERR